MEKNKAIEKPAWKFIQIGVVVKDVEKVMQALNELGIGPFESKLPPASAVETYRGQPMKAKFKIFATMLGGVELELVQPVSGGSPHKEYLDSKGEGIQHIAFAVEDLDKEAARLFDKGCTSLLHGRWDGVGVDYIDLNIGGLILELVKAKPEKQA
jgi:methylmalonyl-CoA/ethylmalonyl-CoA epimerase